MFASFGDDLWLLCLPQIPVYVVCFTELPPVDPRRTLLCVCAGCALHPPAAELPAGKNQAKKGGCKALPRPPPPLLRTCSYLCLCFFRIRRKNRVDVVVVVVVSVAAFGGGVSPRPFRVLDTCWMYLPSDSSMPLSALTDVVDQVLPQRVAAPAIGRLVPRDFAGLIPRARRWSEKFHRCHAIIVTGGLIQGYRPCLCRDHHNLCAA